jgi:drug/metabolite transporter (DMT)-like permease
MPANAVTTSNRVLLGILFMCVAGSLFPVMNGLVQVLSPRYSTEQLVWARVTSHFLFILVLFGSTFGIGVLRTRQLKWQIGRSMVLLMSTAMFFSGVKYLPLAKAAAISFAAPFIVSLLAWPTLGERVSPARLAAVVVGFLGVLFVIRPGSELFHWASVLILGSATCYALYQIITRRLAGTDLPETSAIYSAVVGTVAMSLVVPFFWEMPLDWADAALMFSLGIIGGLGHYCVARAMVYAPANIVAPFAYWQMIGSVIVGYIISGLLPDLSTWIGAGIIVGAGLYIAWCETGRRGLARANPA